MCAAFKTQTKHGRWEFPSWLHHFQRIYSAPFGLHYCYQESDTGIIEDYILKSHFVFTLLQYTIV